MVHLCEYLASSGWDVTLLTADTGCYRDTDPTLSYNRNKSYRIVRVPCPLNVNIMARSPEESFLTSFFRRAHYSFIQFLRTFLVPDEHVFWAKRAVYTGKKLFRETHFDLILSTGTPWSDFLAGYQLSQRYKVPHILDYRDPWTANSDAQYFSRWVRKHSKKLEEEILKKVGMVIVNTKKAKVLFEKTFEEKVQGKIIVVPNGYDPEYQIMIKQNDLYETNETDNKLILTHTGNFYASRNLENFIQAVYELYGEQKIKPDQFQLVSYGSFKSADRNMIAKMGVKDFFEEIETVTYDNVLSELSKSTMNLLVVGSNHSAMIPAKIYDYMLARRPVFYLGPEKSDARDIVTKYRLGPCANINDIQEIKIQLIRSMKEGGILKSIDLPDAFNVKNQIQVLSEKLENFL